MHLTTFELLAIVVALIVAGYVLACWQVARRRKCSTAQVVRETLTIQRGKPGEEQAEILRGKPGEEQ